MDVKDMKIIEFMRSSQIEDSLTLGNFEANLKREIGAAMDENPYATDNPTVNSLRELLTELSELKIKYGLADDLKVVDLLGMLSVTQDNGFSGEQPVVNAAPIQSDGPMADYIYAMTDLDELIPEFYDYISHSQRDGKPISLDNLDEIGLDELETIYYNYVHKIKTSKDALLERFRLDPNITIGQLESIRLFINDMTDSITISDNSLYTEINQRKLALAVNREKLNEVNTRLTALNEEKEVREDEHAKFLFGKRLDDNGNLIDQHDIEFSTLLIQEKNLTIEKIKITEAMRSALINEKRALEHGTRSLSIRQLKEKSDALFRVHEEEKTPEKKEEKSQTPETKGLDEERLKLEQERKRIEAEKALLEAEKKKLAAEKAAFEAAKKEAAEKAAAQKTVPVPPKAEEPGKEQTPSAGAIGGPAIITPDPNKKTVDGEYSFVNPKLKNKGTTKPETKKPEEKKPEDKKPEDKKDSSKTGEGVGTADKDTKKAPEKKEEKSETKKPEEKTEEKKKGKKKKPNILSKNPELRKKIFTALGVGVGLATFSAFGPAGIVATSVASIIGKKFIKSSKASLTKLNGKAEVTSVSEPKEGLAAAWYEFKKSLADENNLQALINGAMGVNVVAGGLGLIGTTVGLLPAATLIPGVKFGTTWLDKKEKEEKGRSR